MLKIKNKLNVVFVVLSMMATSQVMASDIAHSLRNNTQSSSAAADYFELGIYGYSGVFPSIKETGDGVSGFGVVVNGSFNLYQFFIEKQGESQDPILLGYNVLDDHSWAFDVVLGTQFGGLPDDSRFMQLNERNSSIMLGGRLTGSIDGTTVQALVKTDVSDTSNGTNASVMLGRNWQLRNLNLHAIVGLNYVDGNQSNYYFGISQKEALNTEFERYQAKQHLSARIEVGATYPVNQNWVFRATGQAFTVSNQVTDSPLFLNKRDGGALFETSISYVF